MAGGELETHEIQQKTMRGLQRLIDSHDANLYGMGQYLLQVREGKLWLRDPQYALLDFEDFACLVLGKSRTTVERYIYIAQDYTPQGFLQLRSRGSTFTVLAELHRAEQRVREQLLGIAAERRLTMGDLEVARSKGEQMLKVTGPPTGPELRAGLLEEIGKAKKQRGGERRAEGRGKGKGRQVPPPDDHAGLPQALDSQSLAAQAAHEQREREQARAMEEVQRQRVQLKAEEQELARRKDEFEQMLERSRQEAAQQEQRRKETEERDAPDLAQRRRDLETQQQELETQRREVEAQRQELQWKLLQVDSERAEQQAVLDAERAAMGTDREALDAQRAAHEAAMSKERAELEAARAALDEERGVLHSGQQQALTELQGQQAALQAEIKRLAHKEEQLDSGLFQLDLGQKDLAQQRTDLEAQQERIHDDLTLLMEYAQNDGAVIWPDETWDVHSTFLCINDHFDQLRRLSGRLDQLMSKKGTTESPVAIIDALIAFNPLFKNVPGIVQQAAKGVYEEYIADHRDQIERHMIALQQKEEAAKNRKVPPPVVPELVDPRRAQGVKRFALPTGALLGNMGTDSPVQVVVGTDKSANLVSLDLNEVQAMVIAGQQNAGKSSLIQGTLEGIYGNSVNVSCGTGDIAGIYFHFNNQPGAGPVPLDRWLVPNDEQKGVDNLRFKHRAMPKGMKPLRTIVYSAAQTPEELEQARRDYPQADEVRPIEFDFSELGASGVRLFMAAAKNASLYMRKIDVILAKLKPFSMAAFKLALEATEFTEYQLKLVNDRLESLELFVRDLAQGKSMGTDLRPGDLVIADIRSQRIDPSLAMTVFVSMMRAYSLARVAATDGDGNLKLGPDDKPLMRLFKKLFIFDEGHRYMGADHGCAVEIANFIREMRVRESTVMIATQDPKSLPAPMIRLATVMVLLRTKALDSVQYLARNFAGWGVKDMRTFVLELATMEQGEARVLVTDCANLLWRTVPQKLLVRGTMSKPGGTSRRSIEVGEARQGREDDGGTAP